jgi:hypothetical protein
MAESLTEEKQSILKHIATPSAPSAGYTALYTKSDGKIYRRPAGGSETEVGGGAGGGGVDVELFTQADAPVESILYNSQVFEYEDALAQYLYGELRVPNSYVAGSLISFYGQFFTSVTSGTVLFTTLATLIRDGTDASSSTTNQRTSTNAAITVNGVANVDTEFVCDLTSSIGQINAVAVAPGDRIKFRITRDTTTDTAAATAYLYKKGHEVTLE